MRSSVRKNPEVFRQDGEEVSGVWRARGADDFRAGRTVQGIGLVCYRLREQVSHAVVGRRWVGFEEGRRKQVQVGRFFEGELQGRLEGKFGEGWLVQGQRRIEGRLEEDEFEQGKFFKEKREAAVAGARLARLAFDPDPV